jgi:hypothetical protein
LLKASHRIVTTTDRELYLQSGVPLARGKTDSAWRSGVCHSPARAMLDLPAELLSPA